MSSIIVFAAWFSQNAALRALAGVLFFALLGFALFRFTGKISATLFLLFGIAFGALFLVSPVAHLLAFSGLLFFITFYEVRRRRLRRPYKPAVTVVESGGIKRGLTPPEAAVLLEMPVGTVVAVTLLGLLRKGALVVSEQNPLVLDLAPSLQGDLWERRAQSLGIILQPYEEAFLTQLEAQKGDPVHSLSLVAPIRSLLQYTARRVAGHNLQETQAYYRQHLGRARHDVAHFGEGPNGHKVRSHHLEWLLLDDSFAALYADSQPDWLPQHGPESEPLSVWVARLVRAAAAALPPGGLQVKDAGGSRLALGGEDPLSAAFFAVVAEGTR